MLIPSEMLNVTKSSRSSPVPFLVLLGLLLVPRTGCDRKDQTQKQTQKKAASQQETEKAGGNALVFWTTEVESARMKVQKDLAADFQDKTGIPVQIVPVQQSKLNQKMIANKAAGTLPDLLFTSASSANGWAMSGILDPQATRDVIETLGREHFRGLHLLGAEEGYSMVPSDGWVNLTLYRSDLFEQHDLPPPTSWDHMLRAAKSMHDLPHRFGVLVPTAPNNIYTLSTLEQVALSNDAHLLNEKGEIELDTRNMVEALEFYKKLASYTPPGNYYWKHTRLYYLVGRTPQIFWSPFILDELAGAREDINVGVKDLPAKTKVETTLNGPRGSAGYISLNGYGITSSGQTDNAKEFIRFMMSDGYVRFFQMDPLGKFPLLKGTQQRPKTYVNTWKNSSPQLKKYSSSLVKEMMQGMEKANRWGLKQGRGRLISKIYGTKVLSRILVRDFLRGDLSARETARKMNRKVQSLARKIEDNP